MPLNRFWGFVFSLVAVVAPAVDAQRVPSLGLSNYSRGVELLQRHQLAAAEKAFLSAIGSDVPGERVAASRMLALAAWRYRANDRTALEYLQLALGLQLDTARTLVDWSRFELSRGQPRVARTLAERAIAASDDDGVEQQRIALRARLAAIVEPFLSVRVDGARQLRGQLADSATVRQAMEQFAPAVAATRGRSEDAYTLLLGGIVARDGPTVLDAWRSYYLIGLDTVDGPLSRTRRELGELLPRWHGHLSADDRDRLVDALADSRLFAAAALVAEDDGVSAAPLSPRSREVAAYARYARRLSLAVEDYYRRTLLGRSRPEELLRAYVRLSRDLWPRLAWTGDTATFYPAAIPGELEKRFGTLVHFGITAGYYDLHFGHRLSEQTIAITQYGKRATLRYLLLDGMVSNGFQSWAWDGYSAHGGWQLNDVIVQVRTTFTDNPVGAWLVESDSGLKRREAINIAQDSVTDLVRAQRDSAGYLPGVAGRILRDGRRALVDSLKKAGLKDDVLHDAFVAEWTRISREGAVFAHEARHAIDRALVPSASVDDLEFRAKLSEVALSSHPKLALGPILHPDIGDITPHGQANARVMRGLIAFMRANSGEIVGLDTTKAILPQLPLLDDEQLSRAFREMDPMANRHNVTSAGRTLPQRGRGRTR